MKYIPLNKQPNISRTPYDVSKPSMRLDSRGYPHISWAESKLGKTQLNYSYWDGLKWSYRGLPKVADVIEGTISTKNSLILDKNDNMYLAYVKDGASGNILTLAYYNNGWNFNDLSVNYSVGWVGITYYGYDNVGNSSSSSSSFDSSSSSSSSPGVYVLTSSSSSSIDSNSTSSSSSYDDKGIVVVVYDETNSMLKIYLLTDAVWRLLSSKSVVISDTDSIIVEMAEKDLAVLFIEDNIIKYNFFNMEALTWSFAEFSNVIAINGNITDVDMDAYVYSGISYISVGCLSSTSSILYESNIICSLAGVQTYYQIKSASYDVILPSDYVVGNRVVAVNVNNGVVYQLVYGGDCKLYSASGVPSALTWDSGENASIDCSCDDLIPVNITMSYSSGTRILVQSDSKDIYFLKGESDTKVLTNPNLVILNNEKLYYAEYADGELDGIDIDDVIDSSYGAILKDVKGRLAITDSAS